VAAVTSDERATASTGRHARARRVECHERTRELSQDPDRSFGDAGAAPRAVRVRWRCIGKAAGQGGMMPAPLSASRRAVLRGFARRCVARMPGPRRRCPRAHRALDVSAERVLKAEPDAASLPRSARLRPARPDGATDGAARPRSRIAPILAICPGRPDFPRRRSHSRLVRQCQTTPQGGRQLRRSRPRATRGTSLRTCVSAPSNNFQHVRLSRRA